MRKYSGSVSRPVKAFGDIITTDHCSFYDHGAKYALSGNTVALVVRDVATTCGYVYPYQSKDTENTAAASMAGGATWPMLVSALRSVALVAPR